MSKIKQKPLVESVRVTTEIVAAVRTYGWTNDDILDIINPVLERDKNALIAARDILLSTGTQVPEQVTIALRELQGPLPSFEDVRGIYGEGNGDVED